MSPMGPYAEDGFTQRLEAAKEASAARRAAVADQVAWSRAYRTLEKPGKAPQPYNYKGLAPWVPMLRAEHPRKFVIKARKVAFTEAGVNRTLWYIDSHSGTNAAYIREVQKKANKQMRDRFDPAIKDPRCPLRARLVYDQVESKSFRSADPLSSSLQHLYAYGTRTGNTHEQAGDKARGDTLNFLFYDERQLQPYDMEGVVAGSVPLDAVLNTFTGGTPTVQGNILGELWRRSSMHTLLFRCPGCSTKLDPHWEELTFDSIHEQDNLEKAYVGCRRCGENLEWMRGQYGKIYHPETGKEGIVQWVPQHLHPEDGSPLAGQAYLKNYLGWRMDRFCIVLSPSEAPYNGTPQGATRLLLEDWNDPSRSRREKYNEILGVEYEGPDAPFSMSRMMRCVDQRLSFAAANAESYSHKVLTYDWGVKTTWNVWGLAADGRLVLLAYGRIDADERKHGMELVKIGQRYGVTWAVGDKGYSAQREQDLVEVWRRKAVSIFYATHEKRSLRPKKRMVWFRGENIAVADRNFLIETLQEDVARGTNGIIIPGRDIEGVREMLTDYAHVTGGVEDDPREFGFELEIKQEQTKWTKSGADHHLHCAVYAEAFKYMVKKSSVVGYRYRRGANGLSLMGDDNET